MAAPAASRKSSSVEAAYSVYRCPLAEALVCRGRLQRERVQVPLSRKFSCVEAAFENRYPFA